MNHETARDFRENPTLADILHAAATGFEEPIFEEVLMHLWKDDPDQANEVGYGDTMVGFLIRELASVYENAEPEYDEQIDAAVSSMETVIEDLQKVRDSIAALKWEKYEGAYAKEFYDVRTSDGKVYRQCWPNNGTLEDVHGTHQRWTAADGVEYRKSPLHPMSNEYFPPVSRGAPAKDRASAGVPGAANTGSRKRHKRGR